MGIVAKSCPGISYQSILSSTERVCSSYSRRMNVLPKIAELSRSLLTKGPVRPSKKILVSLRIGGSKLGCFPKSIHILVLEDGSPPPPEVTGALPPLSNPSTCLRWASLLSESISGLSLTPLHGVLG